MPVLSKSISIPKKLPSGDDLSFDFLRTKGIEYIESLGSRFWTDYNTHDPGITMLEVLSYAITDLGMRMNLPVENILGSAANPFEQQFFKASEILPNNPVTANDYRKLFIDIEPATIKNCWLKKHPKKMYADCKQGKLSYDKTEFDSPQEFIKEMEIKGFYTVLVDLYDETDCDAPAPEVSSFTEKNIKSKVLEKYHRYRNLCEDIAEVIEIGKQKIAVCAQIDIEPGADEEFINARINFEIGQYLSPSPRFFSLKQMTEKGYASDEIFEGPLLDHGFIPEAELGLSGLRTEVRLSDIINIIMKIDGVKVIRDITLNNCTDDETPPENLWNICIAENKKPVLCCKSTFKFTKGLLPLTINREKTEAYLKSLQEDRAELLAQTAIGKEIKIPEAIEINTASYTSITNHFPENYGIGEVGLSDMVPAARKAKAKQLKGYLLFFDQILASYFKQLYNVKEMLSVNGTLNKTYSTQAVSDMNGIEEIVAPGYAAALDESDDTSLFAQLDDAVKRQSQIKDHLIARFAERFSEYAFLMKNIYGTASDEIVLGNKSDFLAAYPGISSRRGSAFNYGNQPASNLWNTFNVTGLENRIAGLLGIRGELDPATGKKGMKRKKISGLFVEIFASAAKFKWKVKNAASVTLLESAHDYNTENLAGANLYHSIIKILEPLHFDEDKLQASPDSEFGAFKITGPSAGQFSFEVIDNEISDASDPLRILARHKTDYPTKAAVIQAIKSTIGFFRNEFSDEGIFVVEHILLTPDETLPDVSFMPICADDCLSGCCAFDPYSFKISVVLPGYTCRFSDIDFRNYAEDLIRREIPSHILGKICWIGYREGYSGTAHNDLVEFEADFKNFLLDKSQGIQSSRLHKFIETLSGLNSIYPSGKLYNCDTVEEEDADKTKIILGRTNLGTL